MLVFDFQNNFSSISSAASVYCPFPRRSFLSLFIVIRMRRISSVEKVAFLSAGRESIFSISRPGFTSFREIEEIEENLILPSFRKLKFVNCNKPFWKKLMHMAFLRAKAGCDKWHDYEMTVAPYEKNKPIYYEFTACPAAEFAIRNGLTEIMPALCNVDFAAMELLHARLVRTTTCANGCKCDYAICGDQDPYGREHPEYRDENGYRRNRECSYR